ncbi:MAG: GlsB/YeaQ/YmgE family stress response membrane protein [Acidobacteriota bacterium]
MQFVWMCLIGLLAGALAKLIMPGKDPGGLIVTMLLGIAGSIVAGFLGRTLGWYGEGDGAGLIMSVVGAILLLWVYRLMKRGSTTAN